MLYWTCYVGNDMRCVLTAIFLFFCTGVQAQSIEELVGLWESPDGTARQAYSHEFSGLLASKMWFKAGDEWKLVGRGVLYKRPGAPSWLGVTRTTGMGGIELFESVLSPLEDGKISVSNKSYNSDGSTMKTIEDWNVEVGRSINYRIFQIADGAKKLWMEGRWLKVAESSK